MAPEPQHRQLLNQLLGALRESTFKLAQDEPSERRNINNDSTYGSVIEARLRNLAKDLDALEEAKQLIEEQQTALERLKAYAHNAARPVCRVPDEILSSIFEVGVPGVSNVWDMGPRNSRSSRLWVHSVYKRQLLSVGSTCSRLRAVQINTPQCWTAVYCTITGANVTGTTLQELEMMLSRSRNCQFCLRVEVRMPKRLPPSTYALRAISGIIVPHMHRCKSLNLVGDNCSAVFPNLLSATPLHSLQSIRFEWFIDCPPRVQVHSRAEDIVLPIISALTVPLQCILIRRECHAFPPMRGGLDTVQAQALTNLLVVGYDAMGAVFQLLQRCSNLEHLKWDIKDAEETFEDHPQHLFMNSLISLEVSNFESFGRSCILQAPRLEGHEVNFPFNIMDAEQPPFPSLLRVSLTLHPERDNFSLFLDRHPRITDCALEFNYCAVNDLTLTLEPLLSSSPSAQAGFRRNLRRLSLRTGEMDDDLNLQEATTLLGLVLERLSELRVDLHFPVDESELELQFRNPELVSRISVISMNILETLEDTWPSAWPSSCFDALQF